MRSNYIFVLKIFIDSRVNMERRIVYSKFFKHLINKTLKLVYASENIEYAVIRRLVAVS